MPSKLTQAAFAAQVGLSRGRIAQLVGEGLPVEPDGGINLEKGKDWIANNLDPKRREAATGEAPQGKLGMVATVRTKKMLAELRMLDMEAKRKEGLLLDREEVARAAFGRARFERDAWTGWASRAATALASELGSDPAQTFAALDRMVRENLAELAATPWRIDGNG
jgi:hypothetical protein